MCARSSKAPLYHNTVSSCTGARDEAINIARGAMPNRESLKRKFLATGNYFSLPISRCDIRRVRARESNSNNFIPEA